MAEELEDFIKKNRAAFDDKEPPAGAWRNIAPHVEGQSAAKPWYDSLLLWRAAAVVFMAATIYFAIPQKTLSREGNVAVREFNDVEAFYTSQITQKVAMIEEINGESMDEFADDFKQLEVMYMVLKEEWKSNPTKKVKDAMVLNLLVRINLLNEQLHRVEKELQGGSASEDKET